MLFFFRFIRIYLKIFSIILLGRGILLGDSIPTLLKKLTSQDSTKTPLGLMPSIGIGASIGETGIISLWEKGLPSSINSFGLTTSSFIKRDTLVSDTSLLSFSVKEEPSVYSMTFPLSLSLYYLTQNRIKKVSIEVSWFRKNFAGTITRVDTSIKSDLKYYESMDLFKVFIFLNRGIRIPEEYFSVSGSEKTFLDVGIGISPLVGFWVKKRVEVPSDDERLNEIKKALSLSPIFIHGGAFNLRSGITGIKKIDKRSSAIIEVFLDLCANGYFLNQGVRVKIGDIYPQDIKKDKSLFWFSTIVGIRFNLLRYKYGKI